MLIYFSLFLLLFPCCSSQNNCVTYMKDTIFLVENSSIELGCKWNSSVEKWTFVRTDSNSSKECEFTCSHPNESVGDCELGKRISFIGDLNLNKFRFRIDPVLQKGPFPELTFV